MCAHFVLLCVRTLCSCVCALCALVCAHFVLLCARTFPSADRANVNTVPSDGFEIATRVGDKSTADWTWEEVTPRQSMAGLDASNTFTFVSFEVCCVEPRQYPF